MKINTKLTILFLAIVAIPMLIFGFVLFNSSQQAITEKTVNNLNNLASLQKQRIEDLVRSNPDISNEDIVKTVGESVGLGETGELSIAVMDKGGFIVVLSQRRFETESEVPSTISMERKDLPIVQSFLQNEKVFTDLVDYRGEPVLAASRYIEDAGLGLVVKIDKKEAHASIDTLRVFSIVLWSITLVIVIIIGFFISKSISSPIRKLTSNVDDISKGKLEIEIEPSLKESEDEIGELANAFDRVLVSLKLAVQKTGLKKSEIGLGEAIEAKEEAEEKTKELQEYLQLQINRMPIGLIVWDKEFRVKTWNPAATEIFGFTEKEALGKHPYDLIVPKKSQPIVDKIWRRLLKGDKTAHSVNENTTKDGRTIICSWSNTPLKKEDGTVIGVLSMIQDVTEQKKT